MTDDGFRIRIRPRSALRAEQEALVLRAALRQQPDAAPLRERLAYALLAGDAFDEVIELLEDKPIGPGEVSVLVQAHLARETRGDDLRAIAIVEGSSSVSARAGYRAQWLADKAKACRRLGRLDEARAVLRSALALDPANADACKRLATVCLELDDHGTLSSTLDELARHGVSHARLHAARSLARARRSDAERRSATDGLDALHFSGMLEPPPGIASRSVFNDALAAELLAHPRLRTSRYGVASRDSCRIDTLEADRSPLIGGLLERIAGAAQRHASKVATLDQDWARGMPTAGELQSWCVVAGDAGHETWHLHQAAWMSGVYYVRVPRSIGEGTNEAGCIAFGLPGDPARGEAGAARRRLVRPQAGQLLLFPSHDYHRTFAHGSAEQRICVAFDILPVGRL